MQPCNFRGADGLGVWATSRRGTVGPASLKGFLCLFSFASEPSAS